MGYLGSGGKRIMTKVFLFLLGIAQVCFAQVCIPEVQPQPNNPYSYIRGEIKALKWIRYALTEMQKIQSPLDGNDQERLHKLVNMYTIAEAASDDYSCAALLLKNYKDSKDDTVADSAQTLLKVIETSTQINTKLVGTMEALYKAEKSEEIDQVGIAKMLANVQSLQKDVRNLTMVGVKMSTFSVLRIQGEDDNARPVAFTISEKQRAALLGEAQELRAEGKDQNSVVDGCADILISILKSQLPTSDH